MGNDSTVYNHGGVGDTMSYIHSKYWEDADFGQEYKRVPRKKECTCQQCMVDPIRSTIQS